MGIKKLGPNRWRVLWTDELGHQHRPIIEGTKEEAEAYRVECMLRVKRIKAGLEVRSKNPQGKTLKDVIALCEKRFSARDQNTIKNHITAPLGALQIDEVTTHVIQAHLDALKPMPPTKGVEKIRAELSPRTVNAVRKLLRQIFDFANSRGLLVGTNPVDHTERRKVKKKKALVTLTAEECARLVNAVDQPWRGIIAVGLHGLRKGENWGLNVEDVDLVRNEIHVRRSHSESMTKNGRERVVPINPSLRRPIEEAVATRKGGVLFPGEEGARRNDRASVEVPFGRALRLAGIERHIRFHDLRHTFATLLLQAGVPIQHVSKMLGHSSIQITVDTYGHLVVDDLHAAISKVEIKLPAPRAVEGGK